jgi:hypothetical protein
MNSRQSALLWNYIPSSLGSISKSEVLQSVTENEAAANMNIFSL